MLDPGNLELLFTQVSLAEEADAEVLMLEPDCLEDPLSFIVEACGSCKNCIFRPRLACMDESSESDTDSESVESRSNSGSEFVPLGPPCFDI